MKKIELSSFESVFSTVPNGCYSLTEVLSRIKNGSSKKIINQIRLSIDKDKRNALKKNLPTVAFGGVFKNRTSLVTPSGIACMDFDIVENMKDLTTHLMRSEYTLACWVSPSGNGVKTLVRIPVVTSKKSYREHYNGILKHFKHLKPDQATKDINRLTYESYDPGLYFNPAAEIFTKKIETPVYTPRRGSVAKCSLNEVQILDRIFKWWTKNYNLVDGERNSNLFILACSLCNFGVAQTTVQEFFKSFEQGDFNQGEITKITQSAYRKADFNTKTF